MRLSFGPVLLLLLGGCLVDRGTYQQRRVDLLGEADTGSDTNAATDTDTGLACDGYGGLFSDGSFELFTGDGSTWDSTGATLSVTADAAHCEQALRLETGDYRGISQRFYSALLEPGATLEFTGKARWQSGASGRPGLAAYFLLDGGGEIQVFGTGISGWQANGVWNDISDTVTVPTDPGADIVGARVQINHGEFGDAVLDFDEFRLEVAP